MTILSSCFVVYLLGLAGVFLIRFRGVAALDVHCLEEAQ